MTPLKIVLGFTALLALGLAGLFVLHDRAKLANEASAIALSRGSPLGTWTLEGAIAWNEGRPPSDARVTWSALGTTDEGLVIVSAKTAGNEYVYDVDVEMKRVLPANPAAHVLAEEVAKR